MRISLKWCAIVSIFFVGQALFLIALRDFVSSHPGHIQELHKRPPPVITPPVLPHEAPLVECVPQQDSTKTGSGSESESEIEMMSFLMTKFRVASSEVKRQVLKRKGEQVPEIPLKVPPRCDANLIVATYNLWNINPPWLTRATKIADLIKEIQPHFVGVQEIRKYEGWNQLDMLQELLPDYPHSVYEKVQNEERGEEEGIGILSMYPIVEHSSINFANTNRKCLQGLIETPSGLVNFFVTHFILNDLEQCSHALILWDFMNSFPSDIPQILVGDMNTYFDFEWPMDLLTQGLTPFIKSSFNPCSSVLHKILENKPNDPNNYNNNIINGELEEQIVIPELHTSAQGESDPTSILSKEFHVLKDVWEELYPPIPIVQTVPSPGRWWSVWPQPPGHTFSNYGDQDPSRTDRMYYYSPLTSSSSLFACDVSLFGDTPFFEGGQGGPIYPSDHKGVAGYFRFGSMYKEEM